MKISKKDFLDYIDLAIKETRDKDICKECAVLEKSKQCDCTIMKTHAHCDLMAVYKLTEFAKNNKII